jgi:hypothetical protein
MIHLIKFALTSHVLTAAMALYALSQILPH